MHLKISVEGWMFPLMIYYFRVKRRLCSWFLLLLLFFLFLDVSSSVRNESPKSCVYVSVPAPHCQYRLISSFFFIFYFFANDGICSIHFNYSIRWNRNYILISVTFLKRIEEEKKTPNARMRNSYWQEWHLIIISNSNGMRRHFEYAKCVHFIIASFLIDRTIPFAREVEKIAYAVAATTIDNNPLSDYLILSPVYACVNQNIFQYKHIFMDIIISTLFQSSRIWWQHDQSGRKPIMIFAQSNFHHKIFNCVRCIARCFCLSHILPSSDNIQYSTQIHRSFTYWHSKNRVLIEE